MNRYVNELQKNKFKIEELEKYYIYSLWKDEEIVYIGQTTQPVTRITKHLKDKEFNKYSYFECENEEQMLKLESRLINKLRPKYNKELGIEFISITKLREILKKDKRYKFSTKFYKNRIKEKLSNHNYPLTNFGENEYLPIDYLDDAITLILEGECKVERGDLSE